MSDLDRGNTVLGQAKARPLCATPLAQERADPAHWLSAPGAPAWFAGLQHSFLQPLLLDRALLRDLEQNVSIAETPRVLPPSQGDGLCSVDALRLALARRAPRTEGALRELPVSLLRLYFSGLQHYDALIARLPHQALYALYALARADGLRRRPQPEDHGGFEDAGFVARRATVAQHVAQLLDWALCSYERTLERLLQAPAEWLDAGLARALADGDDEYWRHLPVPQGFRALRTTAEVRAWLQGEGADYTLWYAAVWRQHVALLVERWLRPWADARTRDWLLYRLQLYRDTHLDLQTAMLASGHYSNAALLREQLLQQHWPGAGRACCAEELPDMTPYALDNFKMGTHLKERSTLADKLGHIRVIKRFNNICKDRNDWEIIRAYGEQDPVVYDDLKLTLRCLLLGNVPGARGFLSALARCRINLSFWPAYADRVLSRDEIDAYMHPYCHPYLVLEARRAAKLAKEQKRASERSEAETRRAARAMAKWDRKEAAKMAYDKTALKMWVIKCRYTASSLLKEALFDIIGARAQTLHEYLGLDFKWRQTETITRLANGQVRAELTRQSSEWAAGEALTRAFDWSVVEHIEKSPDAKYDIKRGKMMVFHNAALRVTRKVVKRSFMGIIEVKATGIEEEIRLERGARLQSVYRADDSAVEEGDGRVTLDELHFVCYCMAMDAPHAPYLRSALLQVLGVSEPGLARIRKWLLQYYVYDVADDSLKRKIKKLQQADARDYFLLKTVFRLVQYYRAREHVFALPAPWALRQLDALRRRQLACDDNEATPRQLGVCYQCHGCQKFANGVVRPAACPHAANHSELALSRHRVWGAQGDDDCDLVLAPVEGAPRALACHRRRHALEGSAAKQSTGGDESATTEEETAAAEPRKQKAISFLNVAFYNVVDGRAYCIRNRRCRVAGGVWSAQQCAQNVIMRAPGATVSCQLVPVVRPGADAQEAEEAEAAKQQKKTRRRRDDDSDDDGSGGSDDDDDGVVQQPGYETELMTFFTGELRATSRSHRDSLELFARQRTQELAQNLAVARKRAPPKKTAENNKRRIARLVQEPIRALYNCQVPLQPVDMVGIVKNGKVLCCECGVMTEYRNDNMTPYGPTCGHHACASLPAHHPAWRLDLATAAYLRAQAAAPQLKFRRHPLHPAALPARAERCRICALMPVDALLTVCDAEYQLHQLGCCAICHHNVRPLVARQLAPALQALVQFAEARRYAHTLGE